jgi:hypothetical protein
MLAALGAKVHGAGMRRIEALREVRPLEGWPGCIPRSRGAKGSKAAGLAYERKIGALLRALWPHTESGRWFAFEDAVGASLCQPDHFVVLDGQVLLVECKLSERTSAWDQMHGLYAPVLRHAFGLPVTCVQATKVLRHTSRVIYDVRAALAAPGSNALWHCLG